MILVDEKVEFVLVSLNLIASIYIRLKRPDFNCLLFPNWRTKTSLKKSFSKFSFFEKLSLRSSLRKVSKIFSYVYACVLEASSRLTRLDMIEQNHKEL